MKPIRVLSAAIPDALPVPPQAYPAPEFEYTAVLTLPEALESLERPYDLIALSVHFNNGQFYDFLRLAKAHPVARDTPVLVHFTGMEIGTITLRKALKSHPGAGSGGSHTDLSVAQRARK